MSPLLYLTVKRTKNKFLELLRKPLKLIFTFGFAALLVMNFFLSENYPSGSRPLYEFKAIIFAFYILCFISESFKGFRSGGTMFSQSDVNLLFTSPVKPVAVLFHGMIGRLGSSLWMALVFIYQFTLLRSLYSVSVSQMLVSVAGYAVTLFLSQLMGMLVYSFTCGEKERVKKTKGAFCFVCVIFALLLFRSFISSGYLTIAGIAMSASSLPMKFFPVAGWVFAAVDGIMLGNLSGIFIGVAGCILFAAVSFVLLAFSKRGFYEDVSLTAEKNADAKASAQVRVKEKSLKEGFDGIGSGEGENVIYHKHRLENRRTGTSLFSASSLFYLVVIIVYGLIFRSGTSALFIMSCTASIITILSGRWIKELTLPYIYMIPGSPYKKLFFLLPEMLPKVLAESLLQCAAIGIVCKTSVWLVAALTLSRIAFCFLLMSSALITARIFREREKNNVFAAVCVFSGLAFSIPAFAVSGVMTFFGFGTIAAALSMAAINLLTGFILLIFARKLLSFAG